LRTVDVKKRWGTKVDFGERAEDGSLDKDEGPLTKGTDHSPSVANTPNSGEDAIKAPIDSTLGAYGAERGSG
jgi:hypothetical protein